MKGRMHIEHERRIIMRDCEYGLVVTEEDEKGLKKGTLRKRVMEKRKLIEEPERWIASRSRN
jgi:hypothetical protein